MTPFGSTWALHNGLKLLLQEEHFSFLDPDFLLKHAFTLGVSPSLISRKATVSGVFQDLTFKISEGSDQN
jgi:hypothetical protein